MIYIKMKEINYFELIEICINCSQQEAIEIIKEKYNITIK